MEILSRIKGLPKLLKVALVVLIAANVFSWTAYTTTAWGHSYTYDTDSSIDRHDNDYNHGLWRVCFAKLSRYRVGTIAVCTDAYTGTSVDWLAAVQAVVTFGFAGHILGLILILAYLLGKDDADLVVLTGIVCIVAGGLHLIGIIIYGVKTASFFAELHASYSHIEFKLGWSFWLAVVAVAVGDTAGLLFIVGRRRLKTPSTPTLQTSGTTTCD